MHSFFKKTSLLFAMLVVAGVMADTIILDSGKILHGTVNQINSAQIELTEEGKPATTIPAASVNFCYLSSRNSRPASIKDINDNWLQQEFKQQKTKQSGQETQRTVIRNQRTYSLGESSSLWQLQQNITFKVGNSSNENEFIYTFDYLKEYEIAKVIYARTIHPDGSVHHIADLGIEYRTSFPADHRYNKLRHIKLNLPQGPRGSLIDIKIVCERIKELPFSNFQFKHTFGAEKELTLHNEISVISPENKKWKLKDQILNSDNKTSYTHKKEKGKIIQTWRYEQTKPIQASDYATCSSNWLSTLFITVEKDYWRNTLDKYTAYLKTFISSAPKPTKETPKEILKKLAAHYSVLDIPNVIVLHNPLKKEQLLQFHCGDPISTSIYLYNLFSNYGCNCEFLLTHKGGLPEAGKLFNISWYDTPVLKISTNTETFYLAPSPETGLRPILPTELQMRPALTIIGDNYGKLVNLPVDSNNFKVTQHISFDPFTFNDSTLGLKLQLTLSESAFWSLKENWTMKAEKLKEKFRKKYDQIFSDCRIEDMHINRGENNTYKLELSLRVPRLSSKVDDSYNFLLPNPVPQLALMRAISDQQQFLWPDTGEYEFRLHLPIGQAAKPFFIIDDVIVNNSDYDIKAYYRQNANAVEQIVLLNIKTPVITEAEKLKTLKSDLTRLQQFFTTPLIFKMSADKVKP